MQLLYTTTILANVTFSTNTDLSSSNYQILSLLSFTKDQFEYRGGSPLREALLHIFNIGVHFIKQLTRRKKM